MTIEHAHARSVPKPWGIADARPWSTAGGEANTIGEIWYDRSDSTAIPPSLLLKLLFTSKPLSIQVHPDDKFAISIGQPRGKSEAWYILSAAPEAQVALGLKQQITLQQLRAAVDDGSISTLVAWHTVSQGEIIFVPAGTFHAIGAGLVIAEIQQRSDATFRMFDYGRKRELHIDSAIAVANTRPAVFSVQTTQVTDERTILVSNSHFVFERLTLTPNSSWRLAAERETWLLVLSGGARIGSFVVGIGDGIFAQSDRVEILASADGMVCLAAYTGGNPISDLLQDLQKPGSFDLVATSFPHARTGPANGRPEIGQ
jgi:mannose-6-phosphate isomerase